MFPGFEGYSIFNLGTPLRHLFFTPATLGYQSTELFLRADLESDLRFISRGSVLSDTGLRPAIKLIG